MNSSTLLIWNKNIFTNIKIFITDRTYRSSASLDFSSHNGNLLEVEPIGAYEIFVKMKVVSSCKTVTQEKLSFQECVNERLERDIGTHLGCLPPWMTDLNQCNSTYPSDLLNGIPKYKENYVFPHFHLKQTIVENKCKTACSTTNNFVSVRDIKKDITFIGAGMVKKSGRANIYFDEQVEVTEKTFNYGYYNFIIDVGSSIGLWFGLSVFGIYDLVIQTFEFVRSIFFKLQKMCN